MRHQPANLLGGSYADESLLWSSQDTVNWLPTVTQQEGTRTQVKFATPPGLSYFTQCGDGPIRGARDVEGKLFVVSGNGLYEIALDGTPTSRGVIPGVGRVSMSHNKRGYGNQLLITNGSAGYVWDTTGTTLTKITDSGYPGAVMVDYLDHYLIQVEPFGRFWFHSNLDNAFDYNTLDRYDAEAATDKMVGIASNQLEAVVFNGKTIEFFANTGATTGTFQSKRIVIERGCAGRHTIVKLDNTLMWLGNDGIFYRLNGYGAQPISTKAISSAITGLNWANAFGFTWEDKGYKVAYWTFPDGQTWGYDPTQPPGYQWHRRESYGIDRWRLNTCTLWQSMWIGGDYRTGVLYRLDWNAYTEMGSPMVSERTGPTVSDNQNAVICPYIELIFDTGGPVDAVTLPPAVSITGNVPSGDVGDSGSGSYTITGGVLPYGNVAVLSGSAPPGLTINVDGTYSYTYTTAGEYSWTVGGVDADGTPFSVPDSATVTEVAAVTWDPAKTDAFVTLSSGNLLATGTSFYQSSWATLARSSGKYQFEVQIALSTTRNIVGIQDASKTAPAPANTSLHTLGTTQMDNSICYDSGTVEWCYSGATGADTSPPTAPNLAWITVAVDMDADTVAFYINGVICHTSSIPTGLSWVPACSARTTLGTTGTCLLNAGATALQFPVPGYLAWDGSSP